MLEDVETIQKIIHPVNRFVSTTTFHNMAFNCITKHSEIQFKLHSTTKYMVTRNYEHTAVG